MHGRIEDNDMSGDHELLRDILDDHAVPAKWLADRIGKHVSQVYRYMGDSGPYIPSLVWRMLFEKTGDLRILKLVVGDVPLAVVPLTADDNVYAALEAPSIRKLHAMRQRQIDAETEILNILADGKVDAADRPAVARYEKNFDAMIAAQVQIRDRIVKLYNLNRRQK